MISPFVALSWWYAFQEPPNKTVHQRNKTIFDDFTFGFWTSFQILTFDRPIGEKPSDVAFKILW